MNLFDTHFHWDGETDYNQIIKEANDNSVNYFVCIGADYNSSVDSANIAENIKNCWFTAGVHPHYADKYRKSIGKFRKFADYDKFVAIGEVGLDYFYDNSNRRAQKVVFEKFSELALELEKPLVVHTRDKDDKFTAYNDTHKILSDFAGSGGKLVIHCYTGNAQWLDSFLSLGAYIGITGIVTFPKAENVRELIKNIPDNRLLIETDSPYLAPLPFRGKTNFPKHLINVAEKIAELKGIPLNKLAEMTTENAMKFYNLKNNN
jgi:TatD DNase family protein